MRIGGDDPEGEARGERRRHRSRHRGRRGYSSEVDFDFDFGKMAGIAGAEFARMAAQFEGLGETIRVQLAEALEQIPAAMEQAGVPDMHVERMRRHVERTAAQTAAKAERQARRETARASRPDRRQDRGAATNETKTILRLLEEGKISAEEADRLLQALSN